MRQLLLAALFIFVSCVSAGSEEVKMRNVKGGSYATNGPDAPLAVVAFDDASMRSLWSRHVGNQEMPVIDFSQEAAVLLMAGTRSTGGWSVVPHSVSLDGDVLVVDAEIKGPPPGGMVTQVITHPWTVIAVPAGGFKSVRWDKARGDAVTHEPATTSR